MDKKIIITGASGMIGAGVTRYLNDKGWTNLLLVDDLKKSEKWKNLVGKQFVDIISKHALFSWLQGKEKEVDAIIHLGACSDTVEQDADYLLENNFRYTIRLAEWALKYHKRFIYASSAATYGDGAWGFEDDEAKLETLKPLNMYGFSKHLVDLWMKRQGVLDQVVGLKYFNVFGPRQDPESVYAAVIPLWIMALLRDQPCYINGDGSHSRDFCYVNNVVEANIKAALTQNPQTYGQVFNIAFGKQTTLQELYSLTKEHIGPVKELQPIYREERPGDVKHSLANIDQAKTLLGYDPKYSFEEGLRLTVEWFKEKNKA